MNLPQASRIQYILEDVLHCMQEGQSYKGDCRAPTTGNWGRVPYIDVGSLEAQLVADCMEDCLSLKATLDIVNDSRQDMASECFTMSSIRTMVKALKPKVLKTTKIKQGKKDPDSAWARARVNWVQQLLIRFGRLPFSLQEE